MTKLKRTISSKNWILPDEPFPLYQMERRHLLWAKTPDKARQRIRTLFLAVIGIVIGIWYLALEFDNSSYEDHTFIFFAVFGYGSLFMLAGFQDFATMIVTFSSLRDEKVLQRWDLLVLASEKEELVRSKHSFARLRIARVLTFNLAIRAAVLICIVLTLIFGSYFYPYWPTIGEGVQQFLDSPFEFTAIIVIGILFAIFYLIEPLWRVKAFSAIGIALSGRINNIALLAPVAFAVLFGIWILQGLLLGVTSFSMIWIADSIGNFYYDTTGNWMPEWVTFISLLFVPIIYLIVGYAFYHLLNKIAYRRIYRMIP